MAHSSAFVSITLCVLLCACSVQGQPERCGGVSENASLAQLQYIAIHNAYHIAPAPEILDYLERNAIALYPGWPAERMIPALSYTHPPLDVQLDTGARAFELDIRDDPQGNRFTGPGMEEFVSGLSPVDPQGLLARPGMKTFHIPGVDVSSHCLLFADCLRTIAAWRARNPDHLPIFILLEIKEDGGVSIDDSTDPTPAAAFTDASWQRLEAEILSVFDRDDLILPDDIGPGAVWPSVAVSRGHVTFILFDYGQDIPERYADYTRRTHASPILHLNIEQQGTAPSWQRASVPSAIDRGAYKGLIYTKADTTGVKDESRRNLAMRSTANFLATDFPGMTEAPDMSEDEARYAVRFHEGYVRPLCADAR